jgi:hypothetical protein
VHVQLAAVRALRRVFLPCTLPTAHNLHPARGTWNVLVRKSRLTPGKQPDYNQSFVGTVRVEL